MSYQNIPERLNATEARLSSALLDETLLQALSAYGYTQERLEEGRGLLTAARAAHQRMQADYGEQYAATDAFQQHYSRAQATYMHLLKLARVVFQGNRGVIQQLGLGGDRARSVGSWMEQARQFYANALASESIQAALAQYNVTAEKLQAGLAEVDAAGAARVARERRRGDAQQATEQRDAAVQVLDAWVSHFLGVAQVALEGKPQQLEKLGITAP